MSIPADLTTDREREAYKRGWQDRAHKHLSRAGSTVTPAKRRAARANGKKGGRPKQTERIAS